MNYVDRTNLKYSCGDCIIVANLEIFDTRQEPLNTTKDKLHTDSILKLHRSLLHQR